ncbi:MAG: HD-GYP domain-containing protein [Bacillaceae bacterium]
MKGLYIGYAQNYNQGKDVDTSFELLASGDGTDVVMQSIKPGKDFCVYPGEDPEMLEFFFVVEGKCLFQNEDITKVIKSGDYFYANQLREIAYFKTLAPTNLLWFSSRPVFHTTNEEVENLKAVVKKVELMDKYTYYHSLRVQEYSFKIAKEMNLSLEVLSRLFDAATLHDVGKIKVPEEILNKPGRLTAEEFDCMKSHSLVGCEMVKESYDETVANIIAQHHERIDGSGYPYGLKGNDILLEAKIIGVADTYDAMTSDRPYRKGLSSIIAINELKRLINVHYDKEIVDAFERVLIKEGALPEVEPESDKKQLENM